MKPAASRGPAKATVLTAATLLSRAGTPETVSLKLPAEEAFERGQGAFFVQRHADGGVGLYDRHLVEDDGPGVGLHQPGKNAGIPNVAITATCPVKKVLHVDSPLARSAHLVVPRGAKVEINGQPVELPDTPHPEISPSLLRAGDNEIVLRNPTAARVGLQAASRENILRNAPTRNRRQPRSFVSPDGGRNWQVFDGEFTVRLHLVQYPREGLLLSPVIDLAQKDQTEEQLLAPPVRVHKVTVRPDAEIPPGTAITFAVRTGSTPVHDTSTWTDWHDPSTEIAGQHRYLQWKATLSSSSPLLTPVLKNVSVEAEVFRENAPAWASAVTITAHNNPTIRYTSLPFAYENPKHPRMVALRQKWKLDELVAGAASELEKLVRIRNWVANRWPWTPPVVDYPDWDADEILTRKYGFCVQHAIAYMQCAIAMGYQTRFVFGNNPGHSGHEVCETWSNEFQKWIYMDCGNNFHYVDRKTNVPMSMLEAHDLIMRTYYPNFTLSYVNNPNEPRPVPELGICYGLDLKPTGKSPEWARDKDVNGVYPLARKWAVVRYLPRNNFYEQPYPVPVCQGREHWNYSDCMVWHGPDMPTGQWHMKNFTARRADLDWTIQQVRVALHASAREGMLAVQFTTVTPYLKTFMIRVNGGPWRESGALFEWQLRAGANRLEARVRNTSGVMGAVTEIAATHTR